MTSSEHKIELVKDKALQPGERWIIVDGVRWGADAMKPPTVRSQHMGRTELTDRLWAGVKALAAGYRWIDRRDGVELHLLGLAYYDAAGGFLPTRAALDLLEPWYEDMAR